MFGAIHVSSTQLNRPIWKKNSLLPPLNIHVAGCIPFKKLTPFSHGNNVLDAAASNVDSFLWKEICVSSTQMNRPIWSKQSPSPPETPKLQEAFLSKTYLIQTEKQCSRCSYF
jgi:hypothetical protein